MKGVSGGVSDMVDYLIEVGPVKIDNPVVELMVGAAAVAGILYAGYKVLNDKSAADNIATAFGNKADKKS